ncbi:MAG: hypothetical protein GY774_35320 [Planctomycetes bacterium]|nr:hypothetical protein [Planctomycetota bacterium]|tara:strand:- start:227 stop:475 length:249 start_codon:yes stop_codon:yes gene_type:complete
MKDIVDGIDYEEDARERREDLRRHEKSAVLFMVACVIVMIGAIGIMLTGASGFIQKAHNLNAENAVHATAEKDSDAKPPEVE